MAKSPVPGSRRKSVLIRIAPDGWKELKSLSAELSVATGDHVSMQALATKAINTLLAAHGKRPSA